eukprot:Phypoly_transcript_17210.p1 GENE.Phypoly_transcript_17210~~Phypoly_transcript_17210.p1  ORF type:complete len:266 (+),score=22.20 Phypoly_transcript_17210:26-799(+)
MAQQPIIYDIASAPASSAVACACIGTWLYSLHNNIQFDEVGFSYETVVNKKEYWRGITSSFSHSGIIHLAFNMTSLWGCRYLEWQHGSVQYLAYTVVLLVLSLVGMVLAYHFLIYYFQKEQYLRQFSVGYSCVVFGLMTIAAQQNAESVIFLGFPIRLSFLPFASLILTSLIVPHASFIGHLCGIIVGYFISWGFFDWFYGYAFYCSLVWLFILVGYSVNSTTHSLPSIRFVDLLRTSGGVRLENGVIVRSSPESIV